MQSDSHNIRIGVDVGAPVEEGNEKSSVNLNINIGKASADAQLSEMKALIGGAEANLSALVSVVATPGNQQTLAETIENLFNGKDSKILPADITQAVANGLVSYKVYQVDGNRVVLQLKPGTATEQMVTAQINGALQGLGIEAATSNENVNISATATAGVDFYDALEGHKTGLSTVATFGKSFSFELKENAPAGSLVEAKVFELISQFKPNSPIGLFKLMRSVDLSFSLRGIDELPADLQRRLKIAKNFEKFPQTLKSREHTEEYQFFKKIVALCEPQVDVYATLENVAALHLTMRLPGWGTGLITTYE